MKRSILIFSILFWIIISSSGQVNEDWIKKDISIFKHFFKYFPLKTEMTLDDLTKNLQRFEFASQTSIGFDGILFWWVLPGGTISINSNIVSCHNQILMVETFISKDYIKRLNKVFERDKDIESRFHSFFSLKVNPHYFMDSVYTNIYIDKDAFKEYQDNVAKYLGSQDQIDISKCKFEYDILNKPTGRFGYESFNDLSSNDWTPFYAIKKLKAENRTDCIKNIIKGYSLPGRIYGVVALLQLAKEKKYILTEEDKSLINKVLGLNLTVESGYGTDIISHRSYKDCVGDDLLKLIER